LPAGEKVFLPVAIERIAHRAPMSDLALQRVVGSASKRLAVRALNQGAGSRRALTVILKVGHV